MLFFFVNPLFLDCFAQVFNTHKAMKKNLLSLSLFLGVFSLTMGQVGINTANPNPDAILDINSSNKGVLLPRVALTATNNSSPLSAHVAGMMVYNTATNTSAPANAVFPGQYYNDGTQWLKMSTWKDSKLLVGGTLSDMLTSNTVDVPAGSTGVTTTLITLPSFTLDRPSIVEFSANISSAYLTQSGTVINDGSIKYNDFFFRFASAPAGVSTTMPFGNDSFAYTNANSSTPFVSIGAFYHTPHSTLTLPAGTYSLNVMALATSGAAFRVIYGGGGSDMIQIKATPVQ